MPIKFTPQYTITPRIASNLLRIESAKEKVAHLPLTASVLRSLRETARLFTTHYSTMIEGNRLDPQQIEAVLQHEGHFPGRERDEYEVKGYYAALHKVEQIVATHQPITEKTVQTLHALVMGEGKVRVKPTPYRDGQNVIRDGRTKAIIYLPPEAKDVPAFMQALIRWIERQQELPCPITAGIAHYQFATIHPYYDGNGRTARLLTTLILHVGGYDLKSLYLLEEYYARNLGAYYEAISIGDSHNDYMGRAEADITPWLEYFIEGMAYACESVVQRMKEAANTGAKDESLFLRKLEPRQRKVLDLFATHDAITSRQVGELFGYQPRTSSQLCAQWVADGFLEMINKAKKSRNYRLGEKFRALIERQSI